MKRVSGACACILQTVIVVLCVHESMVFTHPMSYGTRPWVTILELTHEARQTIHAIFSTLVRASKFVVVSGFWSHFSEQLLLLELLLDDFVSVELLWFGLSGVTFHGSHFYFLLHCFSQLFLLFGLHVHVYALVYDSVNHTVIGMEPLVLLRLSRTICSLHSLVQKVTSWYLVLTSFLVDIADNSGVS